MGPAAGPFESEVVQVMCEDRLTGGPRWPGASVEDAIARGDAPDQGGGRLVRGVRGPCLPPEKAAIRPEPDDAARLGEEGLHVASGGVGKGVGVGAVGAVRLEPRHDRRPLAEPEVPGRVLSKEGRGGERGEHRVGLDPNGRADGPEDAPF